MVKSSSPNVLITWLIFLCPRTHASRQTYHHSASSVLAVRISCLVIAVFVFRKPLFTVLIAPKRKSNDADSASKPKRSRDVLSISEKVKILDMIEIYKNNRMRRLAGCMTRMNLPFVKWWRTKKKFVLVFLLHRKLQTLLLLRTIVLMKVGKNLEFLHGRYE